MIRNRILGWFAAAAIGAGSLAPIAVHQLQSSEEPVAEREIECFSEPSACGFPDASNTGPSGTLTKEVGDKTYSTDGQTIENKEIIGQVEIAGDNVTIKNSLIEGTESGETAFIVVVNGTGAKIEDSIIRGPGEGEETAESVVRGDAILEGNELYQCNECVQNNADLMKDNYIHIDSVHLGAHVEGTYNCSEHIEVIHNTIFNRVSQTTTIFGDTICGGGNEYIAKENLLAGGGGIFEPQANCASSCTGAETVITGNHIARCTGERYTANDGNWYCEGQPSDEVAPEGGDGNGYYPFGGSFYVACCTAGPMTWEGNVWDDNGEEIAEPE